MKHKEEEDKKRQSKTRNFELEDDAENTMMMLASPRDASGVLSPDLHFNPTNEPIYTEIEVTYVANLIKKKAPTYTS